MAAVMLMLPEGIDSPGTVRQAHVYKVSMGADRTEAQVEIDGHDQGVVAVRRVYPQPQSVPATRPVPQAPGPGRVSAGPDQLSSDQPKVRPTRRVLTTVGGTVLPGAQPPSPGQSQMLNPNGAPIID